MNRVAVIGIPNVISRDGDTSAAVRREGGMVSSGHGDAYWEHRWYRESNRCTCQGPQQNGYVCIHGLQTLRELGNTPYCSDAIDDVWTTENYRHIHDGSRKSLLPRIYVYSPLLPSAHPLNIFRYVCTLTNRCCNHSHQRGDRTLGC